MAKELMIGKLYNEVYCKLARSLLTVNGGLLKSHTLYPNKGLIIGFMSNESLEVHSRMVVTIRKLGWGINLSIRKKTIDICSKDMFSFKRTLRNQVLISQ